MDMHFDTSLIQGLYSPQQRIADGAYHTAVERIRSLSNPHFFMLNYECDKMTHGQSDVPINIMSSAVKRKLCNGDCKSRKQ